MTDSSGQASAYTGRIPGDSRNLDTTEERLYLGGLPADVSTATEGAYVTGLRGCIVELMGATEIDQWSTIALQPDALDGAGIDVCQV